MFHPSKHARFRRGLAALVAAALALLLTGPTLAAEIIYTWTDDEGVRHFSARPPEGRDYRIVDTLAGAAPERARPAAAEPAPPPALSVFEISPAAPDPEIVRQRCEQARRNLELLRQNRPVLLQQDEGEPSPLDAATRRQMIEEAESFLAEWC